MLTGWRSLLLINPYQKPPVKELRTFGFLFAGFFILVLGIVVPMIRNDFSSLFSSLAMWPRWPWAVGALVALWAVAHPASLNYLQRPWMVFADIAGWVNTRIIMLLLFYVLILPIGLIMRLVGYDPMQRKIDPELKTYRKPCKPTNREHMRHPY